MIQRVRVRVLFVVDYSCFPTIMGTRCQLPLLLLSFLLVTETTCYCLPSVKFQPQKSFLSAPVRQHLQNHDLYQRSAVILSLVTEDEVIAAVEESENLWENALEARKKANALSEEAEQVGEAAADAAVASADELKKNVMGADQIANAEIAMNSSIDAGGALDVAVAASEEADKLEALAEQALEKSEELLNQHVIDFPENNDE